MHNCSPPHSSNTHTTTPRAAATRISISVVQKPTTAQMHRASGLHTTRPCCSHAAARPASSTPIRSSKCSSSSSISSRGHVRSRPSSLATQRCRVAQGDATSAMEQRQQPQQQHGEQLQQQQHHHAAANGQSQLTGRVARFAASKHARSPVAEAARPLAEYMALPASQYSVLDARRIERLDDTTFRCYVGRLAFFGFSVEPVITVSVVVEERGCTIKLLSAELQGSPAVQDINSRFTARMTNVVRWHEAVTGAAAAEEADQAGAAGGSSSSSSSSKEISSDTSIEVVVVVPGWAGFLPVPSIEAAGSSVMATTLNLMVPRFLEQLRKDYAVWAAGDESRKPVGDIGV